jgi:mannose-6-phosphate isomerase-like protein (cupin superfamily)
MPQQNNNILQKLEAYEFNNKPLVVKKLFNMLPTWDDVINDLDFNVKHYKTEVKDLGNLGIVTHHGENIDSVENIRQSIHSLRPTESQCTAHIYISLLSISNTFGWHNDDTDVFYVQALGNTSWQVKHDKEESFLLEPGDLIYVPKQMMHNTIPETPRVGISIGFT